jgi:hypothetical protein
LATNQLETDATILERKSEAALAKYLVDAVVANELDTRYDSVQIFTLQDAAAGGHKLRSTHIERRGEGSVIEAAMMGTLASLHDEAIAARQNT